MSNHLAPEQLLAVLDRMINCEHDYRKDGIVLAWKVQIPMSNPAFLIEKAECAEPAVSAIRSCAKEYKELVSKNRYYAYRPSHRPWVMVVNLVRLEGIEFASMGFPVNLHVYFKSLI